MAAAVRSVTFLCDALVQPRAVGLLASMGLQQLWHERPVGGDVAACVTSGVQAQDGVVVEFLSLLEADAYRVNKGHSREIKLLSVNVGSPCDVEELVGVSTSQLPNFRTQPSGIQGALQTLTSRIQASTGVGILPSIVLIEGGGSSAAMAPGNGPFMHEVVLGLPYPARAEAEAALAQAGFARLPSALSVWQSHLGAPAVRVVPAVFTRPFAALVLRAEDQAATLASAAAWSGGAQAELYGEKSGLSGAGQGLVTSPAVPGLDLRLTEGPVHDPFFNESQAVYSEDVDEALNPGHGNVPPLACRSIVGMELAASVKRNLRFLRDL